MLNTLIFPGKHQISDLNLLSVSAIKKATRSPGTRRDPWYHPDSASPRSAQPCTHSPAIGGHPEATTRRNGEWRMRNWE